ncbi:MAG: TIGR04255 family protein [Gemmatimonas sp.]
MMNLSGLKGTTLPRYDNGPLVEVAASVQFEEIRKLDAAHLGFLWTKFRGLYPKTEQHPPLAVRKEDFGSKKEATFRVTMQPGSSTRVWFIQEDEAELVQVQNNMLVYNWRKRSGNEYVGFPKIRESAKRAGETLLNFVREEDLGELRVNQCELTYVNHLGVVSRDAPRQPLSEIFSYWQSRKGLFSAESPEEVNLLLQHVLHEHERPVGRLFADLKSAYATSTHESLYALNMTVRGKPADSELTSAIEFLDRAHEWLVTYFTDFTTEAMHHQWGRRG